MSSTRLNVSAAGIDFQNPLLLAAGTAGYGREIAALIPLDDLGGIVTKAVSLEVRAGAPAPRVAELSEGMINAVGLANPGAAEVRASHLPWLEKNVTRGRVIVNVLGNVTQDFAEVISILDGSPAISAYELNVSCPNVKAGGMEFGADITALAELITRSRSATRRPLFVKLSPTLPKIADTARVAADAGADGITVLNTFPGLAIDVERRAPVLGFGTGGVSGSALLPVGVLAAYRVSQAVRIPVMGVGGISSATDALQYMMAGASLVAIGTAAMRDPRVVPKIVADLNKWCTGHGVANISEIRGTVKWS
ncbi:MAG: dihydroorotate dehydrogenase [Gemmatimonadaceae bacterium]|nr:dihydroorotate dehydrogenase [Gemmatimonadaceae bacterium]